ncbi:MAG: terminase family protein [Bacteroidetes bacterium]|nr:terminase family protein [Bacteroidota bacterium]
MPVSPHQDAHLSDRLAAVPESVLLKYQQRWVADGAKVKVCEKSRRIGLSWAEAADAALTAASQSGMDVYYMAYNQDMTSQFIKDVAFWAKWYRLAAGEMETVEEVYYEGDERKSVLVYQVKFASGHVVQALPSTPRNLRSKKGRAIFDEFAFVDDPAELLKAGLAFLIWGGDLRIISTHNGVDNPFNRLIEEIRAGKKPYALHRVTFEDAIVDGLYERIMLMRGEEATPEKAAAWEEEIRRFYAEGAAEELDCVPSQGGGKYFSRTLVERATREALPPVVRLHLPKNWLETPEAVRRRQTDDWCHDTLRPLLRQFAEGEKSVYGLDFAREGDLTYVLFGQIGTDLVRRVRLALELRDVPFATQEDILLYAVRRLPRFVAGSHDATGNGASLAEKAATTFGLGRIHQIKLSDAFYLDAFPRYKAAYQDSLIELPRDGDLVDDHLDVELVSGVPKVPKGRRRMGHDHKPRHADGAVAGLLLWHASLHEGAPIEFEAAPPREAQAMAERFADAAAEIREGVGFGIVSGTTYLSGF